MWPESEIRTATDPYEAQAAENTHHLCHGAAAPPANQLYGAATFLPPRNGHIPQYAPHGEPARPLVLVGLTAICNAVGAGEKTVKRWIRNDNFPARRCTDGIYRADPEAIRRWFAPPPSGRA